MGELRARGAGALLTLAATLWLAPMAHASLVRWLALEELGAEADLIVVGHVASMEVVERDVAVGVFTDYRITVEESVKGAAPPDLTVRLPGGTVGARTTRVEGVPELAVGERYLLVLHGYDGTRFGEQASARYFTVLGSSQGAWNIVSDEQGQDTATRVLLGGFVDARGSLQAVPQRQSLSLGDLRARLGGGAR